MPSTNFISPRKQILTMSAIAYFIVTSSVTPQSAPSQKEKSVPQVANNLEIADDIAPGIYEAPALVTIGSAEENHAHESVVRTEWITSDDWKWMNATKLSEALTYSTGVRLENDCQNCNTTQIQMLGMKQQYIAILSDGVPAMSGLAGVYGIEQIPTAALDRIEIIRGGGSALQGPNAIAGTIQLVPHNPIMNTAGINTTVAWMEGSQSGSRPTADIQFTGEMATDSRKVGVLVHGIQSGVQAVDINRDGFTEVSKRELWAGGTRVALRPNDSHFFTVDYTKSNEDRRGGSADDFLKLPPNQVQLAEELISDRDMVIGSWTFNPEPDTELRWSLSYNQDQRSSYYGGSALLGNPGDPGWSPTLGFGETFNEVRFTAINLRKEISENHTLGANIQYQHETLRDAQFGLGRVTGDHYESTGIGLEHEWSLSEQWKWVYGARADLHSEISNPVISPRTSIRWEPSHHFSWRTSISTGFRAPELFDEDLHIENVGGQLSVTRQGPGLKEESAVSIHSGPVWEITEGLFLETSLFYTHLKDIFYNRPTDDPNTPDILELTKLNGGTAEIYGTEMNLTWLASPFVFEVGYVEQRSRYAQSQLVLGPEIASAATPEDNQIFSRNFMRAPDRFGAFRATWEGPWVDTFVGGTFTGRMDAPHVVNDDNGILMSNELNRTDWFLTVDLGISKTFPIGSRGKTTWTLGMKNAFNAYQDDLDRGPYRDSAYVYGPRFPRTVYLSTNWTF